MRLTAQDLYNYTKCAHRVYLDANGDPAEKSEVSSFVKLLWEMGLQKELEHLGTLAGTPVEDLKALSLAKAAERTSELMRSGAPLIYQGVLRTDHLLGRPDLLVWRDDNASALGPYYYEAIDIKAGRGWEEREGSKPKFKRHYALQIMFYRDLLARVQGYAPALGRIINIDSKTEEFVCADFEADYLSALREVEQLVAAKESSEPVLGSGCTQCEWYRKCRRWVEDTRDPTGLFFVGKQKFALKERGLATIEAIAAMDVKRYLKGPEKIPGMAEKSLERMKRRALVMLAGKPEIRPGFSFPQADEEIYFDIEDDPTQGLVYGGARPQRARRVHVFPGGWAGGRGEHRAAFLGLYPRASQGGFLCVFTQGALDTARADGALRTRFCGVRAILRAGTRSLQVRGGSFRLANLFLRHQADCATGGVQLARSRSVGRQLHRVVQRLPERSRAQGTVAAHPRVQRR